MLYILSHNTPTNQYAKIARCSRRPSAKEAESLFQFFNKADGNWVDIIGPIKIWNMDLCQIED